LNQFYFKEVSVKRYLEAEALTKRKSGIWIPKDFGSRWQCGADYWQLQKPVGI
jgi:hypothetical protein